MKTFNKSLLTTCILSILFSISTNASHLMGGEISWRCTGTGEFIFKMKIYRDCNGIPFGPPVSLDVHNNALLTFIPLNLVSQTDISSYTTCDSCGGASGTSVGVVEEFIFESGPVTLTGTPPAQGWVFSYSNCCRNAAVTNIQNASNYGFTLRAIMYSVNGQSTSPCFDSSPDFAERPATATSSGYDFHYTPFATDPELDSLVYSWSAPLDSWAGGTWSATNPPVISYLPGCNPFPNPVTLNTTTGEISCLFTANGVYNSVNKVSAYKCGVLCAEIYRDMQFAVITSPPNSTPSILPPFFNSVTSLPTYYDTVYAGDFVNFPINAIDSDFQNITLQAAGNEFGSGFTDTALGCLISPCATLSPAPPVSGLFYVVTNFSWQTTNDHLGLNYYCAYMPSTYYFLIRAKDDFCPVHAFKSVVIAITVLPVLPKPLIAQSNDSLTTANVPGYNYQWYMDRFIIPGAVSNSYKPAATGDYQVRVIDNATQGGNYSDGFNPVFTGIEMIDNRSSTIAVAPNPSKGKFMLSSFNETNFELIITDRTGKIVYQKSYSNYKTNALEVELKNADAGVYFIKLKSATNSYNAKIVLRK